jgi:hypothetical protein
VHVRRRQQERHMIQPLRKLPHMTGITRSASLAAVLLIALGGCSVPEGSTSQVTHNTGMPGWTGRSLVVGSHSAIAGDTTAAGRQQSWGAGGGSGGGGGM